jgi:hypothetical protein
MRSRVVSVDVARSLLETNNFILLEKERLLIPFTISQIQTNPIEFGRVFGQLSFSVVLLSLQNVAPPLLGTAARQVHISWRTSLNRKYFLTFI